MKAFTTIALSIACAGIALAGDFSDGWKAGWCQGFKQIQGRYAFVPFIPFAPFPPLGCDSYRDGYTAGVIEGARAAEEN